MAKPKDDPTPPAEETAVAEAPVEAPPAEETATQEVEIEQPIPSGSAPAEVDPAVVETLVEDASAETKPAPTPTREYVVLNGPASFGPVVMNGQSVRARVGVVYHLPNAEERADVLATGVFRGAGADDLRKAGVVSGGAITLDSLPPGALKGGLK